MIAAFVDGLKASPEFIANTAFAKGIVNFGDHYLPLSSIGMGWVLPAVIGFVIGYIVYLARGKKAVTEV